MIWAGVILVKGVTSKPNYDTNAKSPGN